MPIKICILQADDMSEQLAGQYHSFGRMFIQLLQQQDQPSVCFDVYDVVRQQYPASDQSYDAFLVTGSKADSFGSDQWIVRLREYLLQRFNQGDTLLGICFGHQILALVLGGQTERASQGWGVGIHNYRLLQTPLAEQTEQSELKNIQLLISHRDQVTRLPEQAVCLASSDFCPNAAFMLQQQVLCFQGHPEFTQDFLRQLLESRRNIYTPEFYAAALNSLDQQHDGQLVGRWMLEFVRRARQNKLVKELSEAH